MSNEKIREAYKRLSPRKKTRFRLYLEALKAGEEPDLEKIEARVKAIHTPARHVYQ